jgi:hypothetical protein
MASKEEGSNNVLPFSTANNSWKRTREGIFSRIRYDDVRGSWRERERDRESERERERRRERERECERDKTQMVKRGKLSIHSFRIV